MAVEATPVTARVEAKALVAAAFEANDVASEEEAVVAAVVAEDEAARAAV